MDVNNDFADHYIRVVNSSGIINTFAGNGLIGYLSLDENQPATSVALPRPQAVTEDTEGNICIADTYNKRIRLVTTSGIIATIAGNRLVAFADNVAATSSGLYFPTSMQVMPNRDFFIAVRSNNRICKVSHGIITTVVGGGGSFADNVFANLNNPTGVWISSVDSSIYIADTSNYRIRAVDGVTKIITTIAGNGTQGNGSDNIAATSSMLSFTCNIKSTIIYC